MVGQVASLPEMGSSEDVDSAADPEKVSINLLNTTNHQQTSDITQSDDSIESQAKSIFEGATKDDILEYLEDAKERVPEAIISADEVLVKNNGEVIVVEGIPEEIVPPVVAAKSLIETSVSTNRRNRTSNVSNSSTDSTVTSFSATSNSSSVDIDDVTTDLSLLPSSSRDQTSMSASSSPSNTAMNSLKAPGLMGGLSGMLR